jgi:hypothetical protein
MYQKNIIGGAEQFFHFRYDIIQDDVKLGRTMMNHRPAAGCQDSGGDTHRSGSKQHRSTKWLHEVSSNYWMFHVIISVLNFGHWYLPFDLAQGGGELVEPLEICFLMLGIFMIFISK